jgi:hypothetical protein
MFERMKQRAVYIRPLLLPLILYIGLLAFAMSYLSKETGGGWRYVIALLPMIPGVWLALGMVKAISKLDEMERRILMEAAGFAFTVTMVLMLGLGFLSLAGLPSLNGVYIAGIMALLWMIGKVLGNRRYQ